MASILLCAPRAQAQSPSEPASFEVSSVKPNPGCQYKSPNPTPPPSPGELHLGCVSVELLIQYAFGLYANGKEVRPDKVHLAGDPQWIRDDRFDIDAKAAGPATYPQMAGPMLQTLLADRFHMAFHKETRQVPVYALTIGKNGAKLKESNCLNMEASAISEYLSTYKGGQQALPCGWMSMGSADKMVKRFRGSGLTLAEFCRIFSSSLDRPVVDKTGLTGKFDFRFDYIRDDATPEDTTSPVPTLAAALQQTLGLALIRENGPVEFLVIDRIQKPAAN